MGALVTGDACVAMFGTLYEMGRLHLPHGAHVLEVGCAEDDWLTPMTLERPDLQLTGIDWRDCERPGTVIRGDVLTHDFPAESFDAIVGISSFEHIGLGHYNQDPLDEDGDRHCFERIVKWLKPWGWVYGDVPYDPDRYSVNGTAYRTYDDAAIASRLIVPGLVETDRWYCSLGEPRHLTKECPPTIASMRIVMVVAEKA